MTNSELSMASSIMIGDTAAEAVYIGQDLVWSPLPSILPSGYRQVEYIASTSSGGQYIDLGLYMWTQSPLLYEIDMKINLLGNGLDNNDQCVVFGANDEGNSQYPGFVIRRTGTQIKQNRNPETVYGYMNDLVVIQQLKSDFTPERGTHLKTTTLFCGLNNAGQPFRYSKMRLYYCKIKSNSNDWVRDLVPCLNPQGKAGLYDIVNDVFYTSPNGVDFEYN